MQRLVVSLAAVLAIVLMPAISMAENQNQKVAEYIAGQLSSKFPAYSIHVKYNSGVVTLAGEVNSQQQIADAVEQVKGMPGIIRVINNMKLVTESSQIQQIAVTTSKNEVATVRPASSAAPVPTAITLPEVAPIAVVKDAKNGQLIAVATQTNSENRIAQVSGQVASVADFSRQQSGAPVPSDADVVVAAPASEHAPAPAARMMAAPTPPAPLTAIATMSGPVAQEPVVSYSSNNMPMPMGQQAPTNGRFDQPNVPNYAWPAYAAPNNYSEVNYPRLYCPQAAPYIGPFYPYPQVPLGWRKVTLEWHDGYWWLDFDDGSNKGPFSPLFRSPNPKRR